MAVTLKLSLTAEETNYISGLIEMDVETANEAITEAKQDGEKPEKFYLDRVKFFKSIKQKIDAENEKEYQRILALARTVEPKPNNRATSKIVFKEVQEVKTNRNK
ncbi:hypothetical protein [Flavobacterium sp. SORGH_AS_0622]|uniref:hypothetical protein n=1 Tax=Flavobacterium sp. SORGH_AS_0622 TaxID=3041772 RepID=UPI0027837781|nr:hypothetical protein [Flavobacterium sp. SORGH_AS_0622]MDQ1165888.1 rRNA pseudouridine-1189 N-methylase Emg1 (Nep1/Mra1 family) [Flavobacterium sp. SORGH_AS_0622]